MGKYTDREPPAPTPLDEVMSLATLESAPWVRQRINELKLQGRLLRPTNQRAWTPPVIRIAWVNGVARNHTL
jgi:hypothetical protein